MITKYRAWNKESKEMYACYGFNTFDTKNKLFICNKPNSSFKNGKLQTIHAVEVYADDYILMQSTGFTDKNGVDIYEGDYLSLVVIEADREYKGEIVFSRGSFCVSIQIKGHDVEVVLYETTEVDNLVEVLGNIYENPELLEEMK